MLESEEPSACGAQRSQKTLTLKRHWRHLRCGAAHLQRVDARVHPPLLDLCDFLPDPEEGVAESVHLGLVLRLRGLDHECAGHRPRHGRGVET